MPSEADERLTVALRAWRRERAQHDGVPAYVVFPDATLAALVAARPFDTDTLAVVRGFGPSRLQHYGPALLELIRSVR
jgi:superfamily II DNA helicase RecQ